MRVQYFSDEYISETETVDLIEKVSEKYKDIEGKILYKFPSIKELDKKVIVPDILIASEIMGIIVIVVDAMQVLREAEMDIFKEKIEIIKYEPKYKQQVQNVCIFQSTSRYKDDNAKKAILALY